MYQLTVDLMRQANRFSSYVGQPLLCRNGITGVVAVGTLERKAPLTLMERGIAKNAFVQFIKFL